MNFSSTFRLLEGVPLTPSYSDTFTFPSKSGQKNYFMSKVKYTFQNLSYIKGSPVIIPDQAGKYHHCGYCMYTNPDYLDNYYAFVTNVEYLADGTTAVYFQLDPIQTYFCDFQFKECFVEREHVADDTFGLHTKDEGLAVGEYEVVGSTSKEYQDYWVIVLSSVLFSGQDFPPAKGYIYSHMYSGLAMYAFDGADLGDLTIIMEGLASEGKSDAIVSMYYVPKEIVNPAQQSGRPLQVQPAPETFIQIPNITGLHGYVPKNNKCLCYPYRGIVLSNKVGGTMTLKFENFQTFEDASVNYRIAIYGCALPGGRIIAYPHFYGGTNTNWLNSLSLGDYPQAAWVKDVYSNWVATQSVRYDYESQVISNTQSANKSQLQNNFVAGLVNTALQTSGGILNGLIGGGGELPIKDLGKQVSGGVFSGLQQLVNYDTASRNMDISNQNTLDNFQAKMSMEKEVMSMVPPAVKGNTGGEQTMVAWRQYGFSVYVMMCKESYMKSIDEYFTMFGYRVDRVKQPDLYSRPRWNYIKTLGALVTGSAPSWACRLMENCMNNGIRFWHVQDLGNYSSDNAPEIT